MNPNDVYLNSMYQPSTELYSEYNLNLFVNKQENLLGTSIKDTLIFNNNINEILNYIDDDMLELNSLLVDSLTNLKKAIVGERTTGGYTYTTNIPISKQYTSNNNTGIIENNILLGTNGKEGLDVYDTLPVTVVKNSTIGLSYSSATLTDFTVQINTRYRDIVLDLSTISSGMLSISFANHAILEVLSDDVLIISKSLHKNILIPIGKEIRLRLHKSTEASQILKIIKIGVIKKLYTEEVLYESSTISLNKELEYLCFDICDNNDNSLVDIDYSIKINDQEYERISNNSNFKFTESLQNIVATNKSKLLETKELVGSKKYEDDFRFYLPETSEIHKLKTDVYLQNKLNTTNKPLYIVVEEDITLAKQALLLDQDNHLLFVNNKEVTDSTILLPKGIHLVVSINSTTNEYTNINYQYLKNLIKTIFISKLTKTIREDSVGRYVSLTASELVKSYELTNTEFVLNIKNNSQSMLVETIQLKAVLKSLDKVTCPYISKIIIRGI